MERRVNRMFILLTALLLIPACGDEGPSAPTGDGGGDDETITIAGTVILPANSPTDPGQLRVACGAGATDVDDDGGFVLNLPDGSGLIAVVEAGRGAPILMAWLGEGSDEISARSTAEVMTWLALGTSFLPTPAHGPLRDLIAELNTELDALEAVIAAEIIANPGGFSEVNQTIHDELIATVQTLLDRSSSGERGLIIEPAGQRSGIELLNLGGINAITLKNSYRRRVWVSIQAAEWVDQDDAIHSLNEPELNLEISPVGGFAGVFGTIGSYFTGEIAYTPQETEPIVLQNWPDAKYTRHDIITGGMGVVPPDGDDALTQEQLEAIEYTALKTVVWDFFVPMVMNVGATLDQAKMLDDLVGLEEGQASNIRSMIGYCKDTVPAMVEYTAAGEPVNAVVELWNALSGTSQFKDTFFGFISGLFVEIGMDSEAAGVALERIQGFMAIVGWIDIVGAFADNIAVGAHIGLSDVADRWEVKVTEPAVTILPRYGVTPLGTRIDTVRVNVDDDTGGSGDGSSYAYHWRCSGEFGRIVNPMQPSDSSNDFQTSSGWVSYEANPVTAGIDSIFADVYTTVGGEQTPIGSDAIAMEVFFGEWEEVQAYCALTAPYIPELHARLMPCWVRVQWYPEPDALQYRLAVFPDHDNSSGFIIETDGVDPECSFEYLCHTVFEDSICCSGSDLSECPDYPCGPDARTEWVERFDQYWAMRQTIYADPIAEPRSGRPGDYR